MSAKRKSIVVSYSLRDEAFHRESLLEYTQGNALRILRNHPAHFFAIAVVETSEEADRAVAAFLSQLRVSRGLEVPSFAARRSMPAMAPA